MGVAILERRINLRMSLNPKSTYYTEFSYTEFSGFEKTNGSIRPKAPSFISAVVHQFDQNHWMRSVSLRRGRSDTSTPPVAHPYPFRTDRFLDFPNLSFRAGRNDAWVSHQRLAAFLDLLLNLVEGGLSRRSGFFVMLLRERPGALLELIAGFAHQLVFRVRRWERRTDGRTERNAQPGQNERLIAAKVEHV